MGIGYWMRLATLQQLQDNRRLGDDQSEIWICDIDSTMSVKEPSDIITSDGPRYVGYILNGIAVS